MELAVEGLGIHFGGVVALEDVTFKARGGEILGIIGPNGAGKTTLFNLITGIFPPSAGRVSLQGHRLTGLPCHRIARLGVTRTFQTPEMFAGLSVLENVLVGFHQRFRSGMPACGLGLKGTRREEDVFRTRAHRLLADSPLAGREDQPAEGLAFGLERLLEIVRALALEPRVLLLDEPLSGLDAGEAAEVLRLIRGLKEKEVAVLFVEHDLKSVLATADRIVVLDHGRLIAAGEPQAIQSDPRVQEAYIGGDEW